MSAQGLWICTVVYPQLHSFAFVIAIKKTAAFNSHLSFPGNPYSSQPTSGLLKCPTPPPAKSQSLNRKHSMELGQSGLLSPASLSPMGSSQSECSHDLHLSKAVSLSCAATSDVVAKMLSRCGIFSVKSWKMNSNARSAFLKRQKTRRSYVEIFSEVKTPNMVICTDACSPKITRYLAWPNICNSF